MKVFVVYASAGAGHRKAAEAIYEYLQKNRPDLELKLIDILNYTTGFFAFLYSRGYIFIISRLPWLWYLFYCFSILFPASPLRTFIDYSNSRKFINLLKQYKPDFIISTHFLIGGVAEVFKNKNLSFKLRHISIITDYNLHPFWIGGGVDVYIASCNEVQDALIRRGVKPNKIRVYGIPVNQKFYQPLDRNDIARNLQVDPQQFTVLIITGTIGIGPIKQIVEALAGSVQILVVCGNNKRLYVRLMDLNIKGVKVYQLVDNVNELMAVSDTVLTKAGGLTITEALISGLPMIFFSSIPGLETANASVLCKNGAAFRAEDVQRIKDLALFLKRDRYAYQEILDKVIQVRRIDTLQMISSEIPIAYESS